MIRSLGDKTPQVDPTAFVSEAAYVVGDVRIGPEVVIWPGATIRAESPTLVIGRGTVIRERTAIHDVASIGEACHLGAGLVLHCEAIAEGVYVGDGATLLDDAVIGENSFIAAGALIAPRTQIPPGSSARGIPAEIAPLEQPWQEHEAAHTRHADDRVLRQAEAHAASWIRLAQSEGAIRSANGRTPRIHPDAYVSEAALVVGDVEIGPNASVWPGAVVWAVAGLVTIGAYTSVQDNAVVWGDGPVDIGEGCTIAHGAVVSARRVADHALIANNVTLLSGVEIGEATIVAAAAVVPAGTVIPSASVVMGVTGQVVSTLSEERLQRQLRQGPGYARLAHMHKDAGLDARA